MASLRAYLVLVIVMATVPLAIFALYLLQQKLIEARAERQQALYRAANSLTLIVRRELDSSTDALVMLSHEPTLQRGDLDGFRDFLKRWPMARPSWDAVYLRKLDGTVVLASVGDADAASPAHGSQHGVPADAARHRTDVEVPVHLPDGDYRLGARIDTAIWQRLLDQTSTPSDTFASLADEHSRIMAFEPDPARYVGLELPVARQAALVRAEAGERQWRFLPDQPLTVLQQVPGTSWQVAAGTVQGFGWRDIAALSSVLLAGLASLGIGLLLAFSVARRVREPLRRLAHGEIDGSPIVVGEIALLRDALAQASQERRQAMQALQAKADELETVFTASPVGLAMTQDLEQPRALINPALATLLGCAPGLVDLSTVFADGNASMAMRPGVRLYRGGHALDWRELPLWAAASSGDAQPASQIELLRPERGTLELLVQAVPLRAASGSAWGAIAAFVDISAHAALERERQTLMQREQAARLAAEEANRGKDQFLAMLGHELRNPLSAITAAVEVINRLGPDEQATQSARRIIGRQTQQLVGLMNDLSDIARVSAGKIMLSRRVTDLSRLVWRTHAALRVAGRFRHHTLTLELEPVLVDVDPMRIEQVVSNLLTNATKYTPPGGHIRLTLALDGDAAEMSVADDGVGMSPALLAHAFDPFVQGDRTPQSQGGLGLGLALVRKLIELHGGTVRASSAGPGNGSAFRVRLPGAQPSVAAENVPPLPPLLLVGASDDALQAIEGIVEQGRCRVTLAPDPEAALRCLGEAANEKLCVLAPPQLLSAQEIAAWRKLVPGLPIVALGGGDGDEARWVESGFDSLLSPPFELRELGSTRS
jgi:signal transduction histidine kinase